MNASINDHPPIATVEESEFGLADLVDTVLQHIWLVIAVFLFVVACGIGYALLSTPVYRADALIQVEDNKPSMLSSVQTIADALGTGTSPVNGEIEILRSREVIMKAVNETQADIVIEVTNRFPLIGTWLARRYESGSTELADPLFGLSTYAWGGESLKISELTLPPEAYGKEFRVIVSDGGYYLTDENDNQLAKGEVGTAVSFTTSGGEGRIGVSRLQARDRTVFSIIRQSPIRAYQSVLANLNVTETSRQSSIIRVSYENQDVSRAQSLVNAIARAYLTQNVERRSAEANKSLDFLENQLPQIKRNVEASEDALNTFRTKTNTVSVDKEAENLLGQFVSFEKSRVELELKREELLQRFQPTHSAVKAVDEQIAQMGAENKRLNEQVNRLPSAQRDLLRLQRDAEVNSQLYIALLNNAQQLRIAKAGTIGNVRVIDFAVRDDIPVAPKKSLVVALAALLGGVLGIGAAFASRMLRPTVREASEVERGTGLVAYATVPESDLQEKFDLKRGKKDSFTGVEGRPQLLAATYPDDPAVESLRSLRTGITFALMGALNKNIVITGPTAEIGKSFISANLAVLLASAGKRVLLIETDLRRPQLGRYFGYSRVTGLSDVLAGHQKLESVVKRAVQSEIELDILPSGNIPPNPGELLLSEQFGQLLASLQSSYDHILIDSAPVLPVADTLAVARHAATTFLVVRSEYSTVREVRDATRKLESAGTNVKGFIFNGVKRRRVGYGSAYKYYYGYGNK